MPSPSPPARRRGWGEEVFSLQSGISKWAMRKFESAPRPGPLAVWSHLMGEGINGRLQKNPGAKKAAGVSIVSLSHWMGEGRGEGSFEILNGTIYWPVPPMTFPLTIPRPDRRTGKFCEPAG